MTCARCEALDPWYWRGFWTVYAYVYGFILGLSLGVRLGYENRVKRLGRTTKDMQSQIGAVVGGRFLEKYLAWKTKRMTS